MDFLYISGEDFNDIFMDSVRFVSHISLLHFITVGIEGNDDFFNGKLIKTLIYTVIAIMIYHILIKKIVYKKKQNKN
jgi:hypothetical protein